MTTYYFRAQADKKTRVMERDRKGAVAYYVSPEAHDLKAIARQMKVKLADVSDIYDRQELPRLEQHGKTSILFLRIPNSIGQMTSTEVLMLLVRPGELVLISPKKNPRVEELLLAIKVPTSKRAAYSLQVLTTVGRAYAKRVNTIHSKVAGIKRALKQAGRRDIEELTAYESVLHDYVSALVPMRACFRQLAGGHYLKLYAADEELVEDVLISVDQSLEVAKTMIRQIVSLRDALDILYTHRLNQTVKVLTSVTVILTIPTLISSVYGMNIPLPLADDPDAFRWLATGTLVVILATLYVFRRLKWL